MRYEPEGVLSKQLLPISIEGSWESRSEAQLSALRSIYSSEPGSELSLSFYGTGVRWFGAHGPHGGSANVFIDGELIAKVNQLSEDERLLNKSFEVLNLDEAVHNITIQVQPPQDQDASHSVVDIDALDVLP